MHEHSHRPLRRQSCPYKAVELPLLTLHLASSTDVALLACAAEDGSRSPRFRKVQDPDGYPQLDVEHRTSALSIAQSNCAIRTMATKTTQFVG